jgi:hypothetical protein
MKAECALFCIASQFACFLIGDNTIINSNGTVHNCCVDDLGGQKIQKLSQERQDITVR